MRGVVVGLALGTALLAVVVVGLWLSRSRTLDRRVGSFQCASGPTVDGPWSPGTAQYGSAALYWWRRWSLAPRPRNRWERSRITLVERHWRDADAPAGGRLIVVTCRAGTENDVHLLMTGEAYTGLASWIEATPSRVNLVT